MISVSELQEMLQCAFRYKQRYVHAKEVNLPMARIEDQAHKKALRMALEEGLAYEQHKSLLRGLIRDGAKHSARSPRSLDCAIRHADLAVGVFHATILKSNLPPKPWQLGVDYVIDVGGKEVAAQVDLLAGTTPILFKWEFIGRSTNQ